MRKIQYIIVLFLILSCGDEFIPENPIDPENPDYIPPIVSIVSGPAEGEILSTESAVFTFSGNEESMLFRTRLDSNYWTGWISSLSVTLDYIDEGDHTFYLQGEYTTGDTSEIVSISFSVDAVSGPALLFFPRRHVTTTGQTVTYQILAEEVYDLAGAEFILGYNPSKVEIVEVREGTIFSSVGTPIFFYEIDPGVGMVTITAAAWAGDELGFTGTGVIAEIDAVLAQNGNATVDFDGDEIFRDPNNNSININQAIGGVIEPY